MRPFLTRLLIGVWDFLLMTVLRNWQAILALICSSFVLGFAGYLWHKSSSPALPDIAAWKPGDIWKPPDGNYGWIEDKEQVKVIADNLVFKTFSATPAGQVLDPLPDSVYLWEAYSKMFARPPPSRDQQNIGSCVSFGTSTAVERTLCAAIAFKGDQSDYRDTVQEAVYGGSRVQIGGGKIHGDGSVGAWGAQWVRDYGILARGKTDKYDLSQYSVQLCRSWGNSGVPADLIDTCKQHPVKQITQVKSWSEAKQALASGYSIAVCSNVGFETKRDANGVKRARGSWNHCMCLDGYHQEAAEEYGHIENSWGPRPEDGPVGFGNPPNSGFWSSSKTIDGMLKQGDSWAFSMVKGFPASRIDWFAHHRRPQPLRPALFPFALLKGAHHARHW